LATCFGFIPTGAGPRNLSQFLAPPIRFIPTGVGTTFKNLVRKQQLSGSSPRVWGPLSWALPWRTVQSVHPHGCGDHLTFPVEATSALRFIPTGVGTTSRASSAILFAHRFIPTGVGTTPAAAGSDGRRFIPTGVGTTSATAFLILPPTGSSPRVWGPLPAGDMLTKTHFGSSPRVWGPRAIFHPQSSQDSGSSPRVWGPRQALRDQPVRRAVHPHGCGDHRYSWTRRDTSTRFIPTGVGTTR